MAKLVLNSFDLSEALKEYKEKGTLTYTTLEKLLGPAPKLVDSPDMDARMQAFEDRAEYSRKAMAIEEKVKMIATKKRG